MSISLDNLAQRSDEELARDARAGSSACFDELVRRFQVPLLRFLLRRIPRRADAEDVLQESFLRAYRSMHLFREGMPFKPWMFTIAQRLAINHLRRTRTHDGQALAREMAGSTEASAGELEEDRHRLWATVRASLSDEQFSAVWLYYVEEMSAPEIARVLGRSWVGVKTMLHRARKRLVERLAHLVDAEEAIPARQAAAAAMKAGEP